MKEKTPSTRKGEAKSQWGEEKRDSLRVGPLLTHDWIDANSVPRKSGSSDSALVFDRWTSIFWII